MDSQRIWEIDFLRGIAIILMVIFHIVYDLAVFYGYPLNYTDGFWFFIGRGSAVLFIVLSGVSSNLSSRILRRSFSVLAAAMLLTGVTYIFCTLVYIRFGILHLLGVCMAISAIFHRLKPTTATAAAIFAAALTFTVKLPPGGAPLFIPLGITPPDFRSMDYYPLIPWSGLFFCGLALGKLFYGKKKSLGAANLFCLAPVKALCFLGRHSLCIYLIHQIVIMPVLFFVNQIRALFSRVGG